MPEPTKLILRNSLCPGDIVMLTAAVRELHRRYPGRYLTDVRTPYPELWENNPYLTRLDANDPDATVLRCHYPLVNQSNESPSHCLHGFCEFLNERLKLDLRPTAFKGDLHLSDLEKSWYSQVEEIVGADLPYWIVVAGGKRDYTIKWWDPRRYQEVVDHFRGRILFVQVGHPWDPHPRLEGVLDLRGRTDLRQLVRLVYHAQGVLCPVTSLMHLAAAIETRPPYPPSRPCVVVAGGREPPHWEAYPGHQFIHNVGALPCCAAGACWRSRTLPLGDGDRKDRPDDLCLDVVNQLPRCMHLITAAEVIRRIELYFQGGAIRYLSTAEAGIAEATLTRLQRRRPALAAPTKNSGRPGLGTSAAHPPRKPVTICVLAYGDHLRLVRRCLGSIQRLCERRHYHLVVGGNAVSPRVLRYLTRLQAAGQIDRLHLSPVNLHKSPMMRRMFDRLDTDFVWWFDDDSFVTERSALRRWLAIARKSPSEVAAWGHEFFFSREADFSRGHNVRRFIQTASWFRGRDLPPRQAHSGAEHWSFPTGGCWMARTTALRELDWPDPRLIMPAEDVLFGEALRQQGWRVRDVGSLGVAIGRAATRWQDTRRLMRRQLAGLGPLAGD